MDSVHIWVLTVKGSIRGIIFLYTLEKECDGKMYKGFEDDEDINWQESLSIGLVPWNHFYCHKIPFLILNYFNLYI